MADQQFKFQDPQGQTHTVMAPEGTTPEAAFAILQQAIGSPPAAPTPAPPPPSPLASALSNIASYTPLGQGAAIASEASQGFPATKARLAQDDVPKNQDQIVSALKELLPSTYRGLASGIGGLAGLPGDAVTGVANLINGATQGKLTLSTGAMGPGSMSPSEAYTNLLMGGTPETIPNPTYIPGKIAQAIAGQVPSALLAPEEGILRDAAGAVSKPTIVNAIRSLANAPVAAAIPSIKSAIPMVTAGVGSAAADEVDPGNPLTQLLGTMAGGAAGGVVSSRVSGAQKAASQALEGQSPEAIQAAINTQAGALKQGVSLTPGQSFGQPTPLTGIEAAAAHSGSGAAIQQFMGNQLGDAQTAGQRLLDSVAPTVSDPVATATDISNAAGTGIRNAEKSVTAATQPLYAFPKGTLADPGEVGELYNGIRSAAANTGNPQATAFLSKLASNLEAKPMPQGLDVTSPSTRIQTEFLGKDGTPFSLGLGGTGDGVSGVVAARAQNGEIVGQLPYRMNTDGTVQATEDAAGNGLVVPADYRKNGIAGQLYAHLNQHAPLTPSDVLTPSISRASNTSGVAGGEDIWSGFRSKGYVQTGEDGSEVIPQGTLPLSSPDYTLNPNKLADTLTQAQAAQQTPPFGATGPDKHLIAQTQPSLNALSDTLDNLRTDAPAANTLHQALTTSEVAPLADGPLATLAKQGSLKTMANTLLDDTKMRSGSIGTVADQLNAQDPTLFPALVRNTWEQKFNQTLGATKSGYANDSGPAAFVDALYGNPTKQNNFNATVAGVARANGVDEGAAVQSANQIMQAITASGRGRAPVGVAPNIEPGSSEYGGVAMGLEGPQVKVGESVGFLKGLFGMSPEKAYSKLSDVFLQPDSVKQLADMAQFNPSSARWKAAAQTLWQANLNQEEQK